MCVHPTLIAVNIIFCVKLVVLSLLVSSIVSSLLACLCFLLETHSHNLGACLTMYYAFLKLFRGYWYGGHEESKEVK